jgi:ubiquinone/menaquinone biosynthesis C-methylase UbiE
MILSKVNVSADMHGCMIQGLKIQPGDHILDVGSGCGVTTAMMAFLVRVQHTYLDGWSLFLLAGSIGAGMLCRLVKKAK